jgi:hypothetical protein
MQDHGRQTGSSWKKHRRRQQFRSGSHNFKGPFSVNRSIFLRAEAARKPMGLLSLKSEPIVPDVPNDWKQAGIRARNGVVEHFDQLAQIGALITTELRKRRHYRSTFQKKKDHPASSSASD